VRPKIPIVPLVVGFLLIVAIIVGLVVRGHKTDTAPVQSESTQQAPPAEPESHPAPPPPASGATSPAVVTDRVIPNVPSGASNTIHGTVSVSVRVAVDQTGAVSNAELTSRGPSAYFARLALESARNWKFKPAQQNGKPVASTWILRYEFRRDGTDVKPTQTAP
jgi:TonB family protein